MAAEPLTMLRLGEVTITAIVEDQQPLFAPLDFFPGLTAERLAENRAWLEASGALDAASGKLVLAMQSWLVRTPHHTILIDTCVGNDKNRPGRAMWHQLKGERYMAGLKAAGLTPDQIDCVLCTHLHVDHVGWNTRLENGRWVPTFPNARYVFSKAEHDHWAAENAREEIPHFADSVLPIVAAGRADMVANTHEVSDLVRLMPTPGHTPDHVAVRIGKPGADAIATGDLIHSPLQARYPEQGMRADFDAAEGGRTRRAFLEGCCDASTILCFAHFPTPSTGRVKRWGEGFKVEAL
jgi:glyoxylase-like metal-dependent hydrolase (beta-lactamase superfamily II)